MERIYTAGYSDHFPVLIYIIKRDGIVTEPSEELIVEKTDTIPVEEVAEEEVVVQEAEDTAEVTITIEQDDLSVTMTVDDGKEAEVLTDELEPAEEVVEIIPPEEDESDYIPETIVETVSESAVPQCIMFDFDKHHTDEAYKTLNVLAEYIVNNPDAVIELTGHTDLQGDEDYNINLSIRRANFVKDYIVKKGGKAENIKVKGKGETQPVSIDLNPESSILKF